MAVTLINSFSKVIRMTIAIRSHQQDDISWIISKHGEIYSKEFGFTPDFETHIAGKIDQFLKHPKSPLDIIWVCEKDHEPIGSIAISLLQPQISFINFFLVAENARSMGVGRKLLDTALEYSKEHNFKEVQLETYSCLTSARRLYKKSGFEIIERQENVCLFGQTFTQEFWAKKLS